MRPEASRLSETKSAQPSCMCIIAGAFHLFTNHLRNQSRQRVPSIYAHLHLFTRTPFCPCSPSATLGKMQRRSLAVDSMLGGGDTRSTAAVFDSDAFRGGLNRGPLDTPPPRPKLAPSKNTWKGIGSINVMAGTSLAPNCFEKRTRELGPPSLRTLYANNRKRVDSSSESCAPFTLPL